MTIDIRRLQQLTQAARERHQAELSAEALQQALEEKFRQEQARLKAQMVIAQIQDRAETEANAGRNHAIVMSVGFSDYERPREDRRWNYCDPALLKGACSLVFQHCKEIGLNPTLEYWHDGVGEKSGFNIVIHW